MKLIQFQSLNASHTYWLRSQFQDHSVQLPFEEGQDLEQLEQLEQLIHEQCLDGPVSASVLASAWESELDTDLLYLQNALIDQGTENSSYLKL